MQLRYDRDAPVDILVHRRPRVLFICGNRNHTTMLHQIADRLSECEAWFTPYYCDFGLLDVLRRLGMLEWVPLGNRYRQRCLEYLTTHELPIDVGGRRGGYDLVVTCSDLIVPRNVRRTPIVGVQEGMIDPQLFWYRARRYLPFLPRWAAGTACTGLSGAYDRYCVASAEYREEFISRGAPGDRLAVTGIPNFDNVTGYLRPGHWIEGHVLACTSDGRETLRFDDRPAFIAKCLEVAAGRPLVFKLHPNERFERARREILRLAPEATVITEGSGEELAANCEVLITEWSTLAYVGLALGKETHSYRDLDELRRLLPAQHGRAARNIAAVCREVMLERRAPERPPRRRRLSLAGLN